MDNKKNGIPKLRFPGFTGAWEQRKLGEVATFINGRAYKQNELLDSGKYKVLRVGNFYTNDSWYYSNLELADKYYIDEGDLVYTWSATFGPHIWNGEKVIYHYHIWKIELSKFLDRDFTLQILEADKAKLLANTNGSTMIHVTKKDMESKVISLPNIEEQKKIGSYLMKFDSLITLHQRKLEHLQEQKKGLLQKMFPKNGETVPEVRFPGFTDAWEQRKLGEVAEINPSSEIPDNFEYVDLESVVGTEMIAYRRENKKTAPSRAQRLAKKGDIFYQTVRPYQKNNYHFNLTRKDFVFSTGYAQLRPNINGDFLFVYIQLSNFVNEVLNRSTGTSYPAISPSNLIRMKVAIPTNNEQEKIGAFFKQLDSLIALHQRKLDHLELMKKGLLQQMFV